MSELHGSQFTPAGDLALKAELMESSSITVFKHKVGDYGISQKGFSCLYVCEQPVTPSGTGGSILSSSFSLPKILCVGPALLGENLIGNDSASNCSSHDGLGAAFGLT